MKRNEELLEETIKAIIHSNHKPEDIIFIGSEVSGHSCTWEEFKALCENHPESKVIDEFPWDLIIVFSDGIKMDRANLDRGDADYWRYQMPFVKPDELKPITKLISDPHRNLEQLHYTEKN